LSYTYCLLLLLPSLAAAAAVIPQSLEERLSMQQDNLGEKQLVLGEVTHLTDSLRGTAAEGRATGAQLAAAANAYQGKLRAVTRRMMATISELSLYQVRMDVVYYCSL
jgi:hypothetical protein